MGAAAERVGYGELEVVKACGRKRAAALPWPGTSLSTTPSGVDRLLLDLWRAVVVAVSIAGRQCDLCVDVLDVCEEAHIISRARKTGGGRGELTATTTMPLPSS